MIGFGTQSRFHNPQAWAPPWVLWMLNEMYMREVAGIKNNPRIEWYHSHTAAGEAADEVPWCSSIQCAAMASCGLPHTRSKAASSWRTYGAPTLLKIGAILVFGKSDPDATGTGHVGNCVGYSDRYVLCLGGNQGNEVNVARRLVSSLVDVRWPSEYQFTP